MISCAVLFGVLNGTAQLSIKLVPASCESTAKLTKAMIHQFPCQDLLPETDVVQQLASSSCIDLIRQASVTVSMVFHGCTTIRLNLLRSHAACFNRPAAVGNR